ncbi:MAG: FtsW/RodA/SpoVE family cell cycle protein, partial [Firmicutes bacterium]|nr:FtsW/RodA/SpoVE family cell cycle protein [Bacillota bacterium]
MSLKRKSPDFVLFITVMCLLVIGMVMILSASEYKTLIYYNDSFYYFKRQLLWSLLGLVAMFIMINYDYRRLQRYIIP